MTPAGAKVIWVLGAVALFVIRYPHQRRSWHTPVRKSVRDVRESILLLASLTGLGIVPLIYVATGFPRFADYRFREQLAWAGTLVFAWALWLFFRTHTDLGRNWSVTLEVRDRHALVTSGIYQHIRHPLYAAFWLWALAQALLLPNWVAGPAGLIGFGTLFFCRVGREEQLMIEAFGEEYRAYMRATSRVVPWIY
jgi:protein-S-isoprenylcysteine O-methyltransferase Ste14